jgi:hypothetical protein
MRQRQRCGCTLAAAVVVATAAMGVAVLGSAMKQDLREPQGNAVRVDPPAATGTLPFGVNARVVYEIPAH